MGINMDITSTPDYKFINLDGLDESAKSEISAIIRSDIETDVLRLPWANGQKENSVYPVVTDMQQDQQNHWQRYDETAAAAAAAAAPPYEVPGTNSIITPTMPTMPYTPAQVMHMPYTDWQLNNPYTQATQADPNAYQYVPPVPYPTPIYPQQQQQQPDIINTSSPSHEHNERRNNRNRSRKNDNYNQLSQNDMQQQYVGQFNQIPPMCLSGLSQYVPFVPTQQHPAAGRPFFISSPHHPPPPPPQYSSAHHNNHQYQQQIHQNYPQQQQPPIKQYQRQNNSNQNYNTIYNNQSGKITQKQNDNNKKYDRNTANNQVSSRQLSNHNNHYNNVNNSTINKTQNNNDDKKEVVVNNNKYSSVINTDTRITKVNTTNGRIDTNKKGDDNNDAVSDDIKIKTTKIITKNNEINIVDDKIEKKSANCDDKDVLNNKTKIIENNKSEKIIAEINGKNEPKNNDIVVVDKIDVPVQRTFASILRSKQESEKNTQSFKLPTTTTTNTPRPANITNNNVNNDEFKKEIKKPNNELLNNDDKLSGNDRAFVERKPLPVDRVQTPMNDPNMYRMGEFLLNYQMDKQTVSLLPRGLTNRSNYCYINSILQALLACPPFYNLLKALPHSRHLMKNSSTPLIDNMIKFVSEFQPLAEGERLPRKDRIQKRNDETFDIKGGNAFEPSYVYTMLKNTSSAGVFSIEGRQEDAEEFLSCLLNGISDEMLELMKQVSGNSQETKPVEEVGNGSASGDEEWKVMGPKNKGSITRCTEFERTPLSDIFRGQLRSRILRQGDQSTDNVQPFFTLQLDIEKAESVKAALEILVGKDQVEGMTCSKTKQQIQAWKQVTLEELPVVLILHLKWFDYKLDGCSKIVKNVSYGIDLKVDAKFLSPNAKQLTAKQKQYKLFAVTYHDGKEATKGHYVTDAFHVGFGTWVRYDDSSVRGIPESEVLNPSPPRVPYLLYYRRCDTIGNQPNNVRVR